MANIAIIETGGKQYVVTDGSIFKIETLAGEHKIGDTLTFDKVMLTDNGSTVSVGAPYITGAKVQAELIEEGRNKKINVIRYRPKSRSFKKNGHRQQYMKIRVTALA